MCGGMQRKQLTVLALSDRSKMIVNQGFINNALLF